uniref:Uncharacterized protein n=1 Tax=Glossina austeni TaxID=7395 RepID=A0A1A9VJ52_GLOAU
MHAVLYVMPADATNLSTRQNGFYLGAKLGAKLMNLHMYLAASKMKGSLRRVFSNLPKRTIRPTSKIFDPYVSRHSISRTLCAVLNCSQAFTSQPIVCWRLRSCSAVFNIQLVTKATPSSSEDNSRPSRTICINSSHKLRNSVCRFSISFKRNSMRERSQFKSSGKLRFIKARTCVDAVKFVANSLLAKCVMAVGAIIADVSGGVGA